MRTSNGSVTPSRMVRARRSRTTGPPGRPGSESLRSRDAIPDRSPSPSSSSGWAGSRAAEFCEPPLEQAPLGVIVDQCQRSTVGITGLFRSAESPQQLTPCRVQVAVVLQWEAVGDLEARLGTLRLGDGDRSVQLHNRGAGEAGQLAIEGGDLWPIAWLIGMQGCDRGLHQVGATAEQREGTVERRPTVGNLRG